MQVHALDPETDHKERLDKVRPARRKPEALEPAPPDPAVPIYLRERRPGPLDRDVCRVWVGGQQ